MNQNKMTAPVLAHRDGHEKELTHKLEPIVPLLRAAVKAAAVAAGHLPAGRRGRAEPAGRAGGPAGRERPAGRLVRAGGGAPRMIYETIEAAYRYGRPDADLLLHETVEAVLAAGGNDKDRLYKIRMAYAAAKSGKALRSAEMRQEGESHENV